MISKLDAVVVEVNDLAAAVHDYEALTGVTGVLEQFRGDDSACFQLTNMRLRLVTTGGRQGLKQMAFQSDDLAAAKRRLKSMGISVIEAESDDDFLSLSSDTTRGIRLAVTAATDSTVLSDAPNPLIAGLDHAVIASGDGDYTAALLSGRLQLDMRLDLTNPDWDSRLMFFRCGDLIVEVYQPLSKPLPVEQDRFFGLSWRTDNIDETHGLLSARGFDVSPVKAGRKPGTRVCTVRDKTHGVPTLILGGN
jgi:catechol 2,3-dioxygenase-like lactoylglutathione lyase family enzyme